MSTNKYN